jgi:SAM-dependent methyltransferase
MRRSERRSQAARPGTLGESGDRTGTTFWDEYWTSLRLPVEIEKSTSLLVSALTDVFDRFLQSPRPLSVLEIGGAPGQYGAYIHRRLGHSIAILDSSPIGCEKARENFKLLGIPARVFEGDMFDPPPELGRFDAVFSLGLIEHFDDVVGAVAAHVALVSPGGLLVLGIPNFSGINGVLMRRLAPSFLAAHQTETMHERAWETFESRLPLDRLARGFIGGFEPSAFWRCERPTIRNRLLHQALWGLSSVLGRDEARFLRRANSRFWSAYLMGVYRVSLAG